MGLADFLADAGRGTAVGQIAGALGGQTTGQRNLDAFVNEQLPALVDQLHKAGTRDEITQAGQALITSGLKAGLPAQSLDKLMEMTVGPALQNMRSGEIEKIRADYGAQPAQPRPQGTEGPLTPSGNFIDPKAEKPLDLNFSMRLAQATGANPEQFRQMLGTPADIAGKELSNQKTQRALEADQAKEGAIQGLSNTPQAEGLPSAQAVARINPPGIVQFLANREDSQSKQEYNDQMLKLKEQGLENTLSMANQRVGAAGERANLAEARAGFNQTAELRKEFQAQSKNFQTIRDSRNRVLAADDGPAGSMSALYNFMHVNDPGARVTDQDFKNAATARPLMERLGLTWDSIKTVWDGKRLTTGQRRDINNAVENIYNAEAQQHQKRVGEYTRLAKQQNLNPANVITDMEATGEAPAAPAQAPAGQGRYSQGVPSGSGTTGQGGAPAQSRRPTPEEIKAAKQRLGIP